MEHCLETALAGRAPSYLTPLLWLHGEEETLLREEVAQMHENGIGSFVVESRPHPDFLGPRRGYPAGRGEKARDAGLVF